MEYILEKALCPSARAKEIINEKLNQEVCYEKSGKPTVLGSYISISHSYDRVLVGFSENPIGVDIEKLHPYDARLIPRFFSKNEQEYIKNDTDFFKIWTLKEAYLKLTGEGLKGIKFNVVNNGKIEIQGYKILSFEQDGYMISICYK